MPFNIFSHRHHKSTAKAVLLYLAAIAAGVGLAELYLWVGQWPESRYEGIYEDGLYAIRDDVLGYAPTPNITRPSAKRYVGADLIYDVRYSLDANGLRRTIPNGSVSSSAPCVLFFGGSFTFGEGVNDEEAMPQQVAIRAPEPVRVYNFGFHGYGPTKCCRRLSMASSTGWLGTAAAVWSLSIKRFLAT